MRALLLAALLALGAGAPSASASEDGWSVALTASSTGGIDSVVTGVRAGATEAYDRGVDSVEAPAPMGADWVRLFATAPATRAELGALDQSFVAPGSMMRWSLVAQRGEEAGNVTLAGALRGVPDDVVVEVRVANVTYDMRAHATLTLPFQGRAVTMDLLAYRRIGNVPGPPEDVRALPGGELGAVALSWRAPDDDGGLPIREYIVFRGGTPVGRSGVTSYVDRGVPFGLHTYSVVAINALGEGAESCAAFALSIARPNALHPEGEPPAVTRFTSEDAAAMLVARGRANESDPRTYDLTVAVARQETTLTFYTDGRLGTIDAAPFASLAGVAPGTSVGLGADATGGPRARLVIESSFYRLDESFGADIE